VTEDATLADVLLAVATELDGHPDNAAPAVLGGFTVVVSGVPMRFDPHPSVEPVLLIPAARVATADARRTLSASVARDDAVFNLGHASLATIALTRRPDLLAAALHDRLHEEARAALMPASAAVLAELRQAGVPACLSGAGPTVLAFEVGGVGVPPPPDGWRVVRPGVRASGVEIEVD
jgi:homoserine kinase